MLTTATSLADQVAWMIEALCKLVAREGRRLHVPRPLIMLAWNRVARPAAATPWRTRHVGWVLRLMRAEVANCAGALEHFLTLPETAELVGAAPQAGRILRPLCQILGVKTPPWLRLARRAPPALPGVERADETDPACAGPVASPAPPDASPSDPPDAGPRSDAPKKSG